VGDTRSGGSKFESRVVLRILIPCGGKASQGEKKEGENSEGEKSDGGRRADGGVASTFAPCFGCDDAEAGASSVFFGGWFSELILLVSWEKAVFAIDCR
jgi:hypothetical protein